MNRRVSMLCLILVGAAGMLFATAAPAEELPFDVHNHGRWYAFASPAIPTQVEILTLLDIPDGNIFGFTRARSYDKLDLATGVYSDGLCVYINDATGEVLFVRVTGHVATPTEPQTIDMVFAGGTGRFRGASGTCVHNCYPTYWDEWGLHGWTDCHSHSGTISLPNWLGDPKLEQVPMTTREGDVQDFLLQPHLLFEGIPGYYDPVQVQFLSETTVGIATHCGQYLSEKVSLIDLSDLLGGTGPGKFDGFFDLTAANGDKMRGFYEGFLFPQSDDPAAPMDVDMQLWITGGTGCFLNASGYQSGGGLFWPGGEDITLEGWISSVGSSKK